MLLQVGGELLLFCPPIICIFFSLQIKNHSSGSSHRPYLLTPEKKRIIHEKFDMLSQGDSLGVEFQKWEV